MSATEELKPKQRAFVEAYLTCWNATEAAREAGYAHPNQQGPRMLVNVGIRAAIAERLAEKTMQADEVLARLSEHATASLADFISIDEENGVFLDLAKAREAGKLHLVKTLTRGKFGWRFELHDAQAALVHLGRHYGLFKDLNIHIDYSNLTDEQLQRIANGEDPLKVVVSGSGADPRPG